MSELSAPRSLDEFFAHHLQTVVARLEHRTERALERQRAARRDALHRGAVLADKMMEEFEDRTRKT